MSAFHKVVGGASNHLAHCRASDGSCQKIEEHPCRPSSSAALHTSLTLVAASTEDWRRAAISSPGHLGSTECGPTICSRGLASAVPPVSSSCAPRARDTCNRRLSQAHERLHMDTSHFSSTQADALADTRTPRHSHTGRAIQLQSAARGKYATLIAQTLRAFGQTRRGKVRQRHACSMGPGAPPPKRSSHHTPVHSPRVPPE